MKKSILSIYLLAIGLVNAQYDGRVGINNSEPSATLNVKSKIGNNTSATKNLELQNGDGTILLTVLDDGSTTFNSELEVKRGIKIVDGTQGEGKILTSDANGLASWKTPESKNAHYTKQSLNTSTNVELVQGKEFKLEDYGAKGFTAPAKGKYLIIYHSFFKSTSDSMKSFYFAIYKNGSRITNDESYLYIAKDSWFNAHYSTVIDANAGDKINYTILAQVGAPLYIISEHASRNSVEVMYLGI